MKLQDLIEKTVPIVSDTPLAKKLRQYRGINFLVLDEGEPPDVHGIPKELEAYGRGGFTKSTNEIFLDGGATGSREGHPTNIEDGFYWGADQDVLWKFGGQEKRGVLYIRGRAGTDNSRIEKNINKILELIFKKLPRK
jgi:hypothetical protein